MASDPDQMNNLLVDLTGPKDIDKLNGTLLDYPLRMIVTRLDALQLVLKSCKNETCRAPWKTLHPQGNVSSLLNALDSRYDDFYNSQPKVEFSECKQGYLIGAEGPQKAKTFPN
jgi:N-acetylglucosamine-6-sulfatase